MHDTRTCVTGCTLPGQHSTDCPGDDCRGCLPAAAAHGSLACPVCADRAAALLPELADLWADLAVPARLRPTHHPRPRGGGNPEACPDCDTGAPCTRRHSEGPAPISPARVAARDRIRRTLDRWCVEVALRYHVHRPAPAQVAATTRVLAHHGSIQAAGIGRDRAKLHDPHRGGHIHFG